MVQMVQINNVSFPHFGLEFEMKEAVNIFGFNIYWYGIIIGIGMAIAVGIAFWEFHLKNLKSDDLVDFVIFAIPLGILGARIYYVIFEWDYYKGNMADWLAVWEGGLAIYGGIIAGAIVAVVFTKIKKISFLWFADLATCGLFIAQSIGRWGNFVNAEAHGGPTDLPWGMVIGSSEPVHPTFLYESIWNFAGFIVSYFIIYKIVKKDGLSFSFYLFWYGLGRSWIEGMRTDSLYIDLWFFGKQRVSQLVAYCCILAGISLAIYVLRFRKKEINQ